MSTNAHHGRSRRAALRLRAIRERITGLRERARRAATLALATAGLALAPTVVQAQLGQTAMTPAGGLVNRAVAGFQGLNENGPGVLYYGLNAADRGLGYQGSYMTLGGFVPMAEDDLGGFWSADLRSHLSVYGGFFSNVGAVRKQFIGGTLLGVGVYWDYDGDQNQYQDVTIPSAGTSYVFPGGQTYNQVGISGEWLTDLGNLRSNGYIPVGSTGQIAGPFLGNSILCVNGVNAALGGTDLEVGAYIPGLADWAGMISVGGYAYGNTRYQFENGQGAVPWFGGVYTRLDLTFLENWDFSLQANNDSYFDWTGFARLTYRMGGSRRRNVSDQVEQPMMRNEHIVRAHQVPVVAINPVTGAAWQVYHVDNTAAPGGAGTAEAPFSSLLEADGAATAAYDIVYVHRGTSSASNPYVTPLGGFGFNADNQYLVGEGTTLALPTTGCGDRTFFTGSGPGAHPVIANPGGTAIVVDRAGSTVSNLSIVNSPLGISDGAGLTAPGRATIQNVTIAGNAGAPQRGILIANSTGTFSFDNVQLSNLSDDGLVLAATNGRVNVTNSQMTDIDGSAIRVSGGGSQATIDSTSISRTAGIAVASAGAASVVTLTSGTIADTTGNAVVASGPGAQAVLQAMRITDTSGTALATTGAAATISATASRITTTGNPAILLAGADSRITIDRTRVENVTGVGVLVEGPNTVFRMRDASVLSNVSGDGIFVDSAATLASVSGGSIIQDIGGDGIRTEGTGVQLAGATIRNVGGVGIRGTNVLGTEAIWVQGATINNAVAGGILAIDSNLRVEQLDPTDPRSARTTISSTGPFGIQALSTTGGLSTVLVDRATISGVEVGIELLAAPGAPPAIPEIAATVTNNSINSSATGINVSGFFDASIGFPGRPLSRVFASIRGNTFTTTSDQDILLTTAGDPTLFQLPGGAVTAPAAELPLIIAASNADQLGNLNGGAAVEITPAPPTSRPNFESALVPPLPPPPPPLP
jgi:hypothetical protein